MSLLEFTSVMAFDVQKLVDSIDFDTIATETDKSKKPELKDEIKDKPKDELKDKPKDEPKDKPKEELKVTPKDELKVTPKEPKEELKVTPKTQEPKESQEPKKPKGDELDYLNAIDNYDGQNNVSSSTYFQNDGDIESQLNYFDTHDNSDDNDNNDNNNDDGSSYSYENAHKESLDSINETLTNVIDDVGLVREELNQQKKYIENIFDKFYHLLQTSIKNMSLSMNERIDTMNLKLCRIENLVTRGERNEKKK